VLADIPGLIEGAHEGKGLGVQFLKHIERTRLLLHVVDLYPPDGSDPFANFVTIRKELAEYSAELADRPALIAANKIDLASDDKALKKLLRQVKKDRSELKVMAISCATGAGLPELTQALYDQVRGSILPSTAWGKAAPVAKSFSGVAPAAVVAPKPASALVQPLPEATPVPPEKHKIRPHKFMPMAAMPVPVDPENSPLQPAPAPKDIKLPDPRPDLRAERRKAPPGVGRQSKIKAFVRKGRRGKR
jgi:hypothetical protein